MTPINRPASFDEFLGDDFIQFALQEAARQAAREHYLSGTKMVGCKNGKVVFVSPTEIYPFIGQPPGAEQGIENVA